MSDNETLKSRIEELEQKTMHQQDTIDELNEMVTKQWSMIDKMMKKLTDVDDQIYALENQTGGSPSHQPPPHY